MMPHDVATDSSRLLRFQNEVAYTDRMQPSPDEARDDTELLGSKDGLLVIAWLWPSLTYDPDFDPLDVSSGEIRVRWEGAVGDAGPVGEKAACRSHGRGSDPGQQRPHVAAERFRLVIESISREVGRSVEDVKTHLKWSAHLAHLELDRLLHGHEPFPFPVIVRLCSALQLEFTDTWVLVDPERLERRIDQSVLASGISDRLRSLTLADLESVAKRLPQPTVSDGQAQEREIYRAPRQGGRYGSLYEALSADVRDNPVYTLDAIDRLLIDGGEQPLPPSARASDDPSWWAGTGAKTEGRPQVSAWWAAGYRIRNIAPDSASDQVASIEFEALPGRAEWRANTATNALQGYRPPGPLRLRIYPHAEGMAVATPGSARLAEALMRGQNLEVLKASLSLLVESLRDFESQNVPDDLDIRHLTELLDTVGEADRSQIERHFNVSPDKPINAAWMTNLLTKARRQGWTVNKGTRRQPRWAATRRRALLLDGVADKCNLEAPVIGPVDPVPVEFLRLVAQKIDVHSTGTSAPQIAREIVESRGGRWQPEFESADESVTSLGLAAIDEAIGASWVWRPEWDDL